MNYIFGEENWVKNYRENPDVRDNIWIHVSFSNGSKIYLDDIKQWLTISDYCSRNNLNVVEIGLKYRSNEIKINCKDYDGVYLVTSLKGSFGGETRYCYTSGLIKDGNIKKTLWSTPELLEDGTFDGNLEECFEEAIVYNDKKRKAQTIQ